MARTSSLKCLSCRNPYKTPHSLNPSPLFTETPFFCTEECCVASTSQKSAPTRIVQKIYWCCSCDFFWALSVLFGSWRMAWAAPTLSHLLAHLNRASGDKVQASPKVLGKLAGKSLKVLSPQKNSSNKRFGAPIFLRDLSQVVDRTPRDTPVTFCTCTTP